MENQTSSHVKHFIFNCAGLYYALPVNYVIEVVQVNSLIPGLVNFAGFCGHHSFRDGLVPIFDLLGLFNHSDTSMGGKVDKTVLILKKDNLTFGLLIDRFIEVASVGCTNIAENGRSSLIHHATKYRDTSLAIINVEYLTSLLIEEPLFADSRSSDETRLTQQIAASVMAEPETDLFCFTLGELHFGLPIHDVTEVIENCGVAPLFRVPDRLRGLINLRGQIIACFDISPAFNYPLRRLEENNKYIILRHDEKDMALCIDRVTKLHKVKKSQIQEVKGLLPTQSNEYVNGVMEDGSARILVLSTAQIFSSECLEPFMEAI